MRENSVAYKAAAAFAAISLWGGSNFAFEAPLSERSVREAYFLGQQNNQATAAFLRQYSSTFPVPESGPYVSQVWLLTPYAQVVRNSGLHSIGYSAQQAAADYHGLGDSLLIEVRIELTPTYTLHEAQLDAEDAGGELNRHFSAEEFWRAYHFSLAQAMPEDGSTAEETSSNTSAADSAAGKDPWQMRHTEPAEIRGEPIYGDGYLRGAMVFLRYDAGALSSSLTRFTVTLSQPPEVTATFDLAKLK